MRVRNAIPWLLVLAVIGTACQLGGSTAPESSICAGIDAQMGGCDEDLPAFSGTGCAEVGSEFGALLNERTLGVVRGPEIVDGHAWSVRLRQEMALLASLANNHLRASGLHAACDLPEFLAAAEVEFSPELRATVGDVFFDGEPPASYEEWRDEVRANLAVIGAEE